MMKLLKSEKGQTMVEYALIIALIVIAAIVGMTVFGDRIAAVWVQITAAL